MAMERTKLTASPDPVPPAPLRGKSFVLADGRTYVIPPPTLAQIHGPCATAFATVVNVIAAEQWGVTVAVEKLVYNALVLVHEAMSRNYDLPIRCAGAAGKSEEGAPAPPLCGACVACLLDMECLQPVLVYLTEVSGYRELLRLVGETQPATASLGPTAGALGTKPTIN